MEAEKLPGAGITFVNDFADAQILYEPSARMGYLRVSDKLARGIPPGLEVHFNHRCWRHLLEEEYGEMRWLFWTNSAWCVVVQRKTEDNIPLERGVYLAGRWTAD